MISELNGVEKRRTTGRATVPETLMGIPRCRSTLTIEVLLLASPASKHWPGTDLLCAVQGCRPTLGEGSECVHGGYSAPGYVMADLKFPFEVWRSASTP